MVNLISKNGSEITRTVKEAEKLLDYCRRVGKDLIKLNDDNYEYSAGNLRKKKAKKEKNE